MIEILNSNEAFITGLALLQAVIVFCVIRIIEHKNLQLKIMQGCIDQYRKTVKNDCISEDNIQAYLEIINEEIYYLKKGLIPQEIESEWLTNMINYLPLFSLKEDKNVNFNNPVNINILEKRNSIFAKEEGINKLIPYPRILKLIVLKKLITPIPISANLNEEYDNYDKIAAWKKKVHDELLKNLNRKPICRLIRFLGL